jgi:hypothetical protein
VCGRYIIHIPGSSRTILLLGCFAVYCGLLGDCGISANVMNIITAEGVERRRR